MSPVAPNLLNTITKMESEKIILGDGEPFNRWRSSLQARLGALDVLGHVFHHFPVVPPVVIPEKKQIDKSKSEEEQRKDIANYQTLLRQWTLGELKAKDAILSRLSVKLIPEDYDCLTPKQRYDEIAETRVETSTAPYSTALKEFLSTKFVTTADDYCNRFLTRLQSLNNAAQALSPASANPADNKYKYTREQAAAIFVVGTEAIEWLANWRDTRAITSENTYAS